MSGAGRKASGYVLGTLALLAIWQLAAWALRNPALPGPAPAIADFARLLPGELAPHLLVSAWRVLAALALGLVFGVPLGLLLGRSPRADAVLAPVVFLSYPVPKVVFLPVFLTLLGIGTLSTVALIAVIVFFQILVTARDAARAVPPSAVLSLRSLGATPAGVLRHAVVPASLPEVFTALRIASGTAVAVLLFSESIAGSSGLGYYIIDAWGRIAYSEMFAGILAMALLGVVLYEVLEAAEAASTRWRRAGG